MQIASEVLDSVDNPISQTITFILDDSNRERRLHGDPRFGKRAIRTSATDRSLVGIESI